MSNLNILISGGGIAGPCLAWFLTKRLQATVTVVERAPSPRTSGQAVDIRDAAVPIMRRMGLEEDIKNKNTTEEGTEFVYADGKTKASFPASGDSKTQSLTSEYEILRGDLAKIIFEATKDGVRYVFDEYVTGIEELDGEKVKARFANHLPETQFDLVVGADGMISNTRRIVFGRGPEEKDYLKPLGQYIAFFTIPREEGDTKWAQWYNAPNGRLVFLRPDQYGDTRAYLAVTDSNLSRFAGIEKAMSQGQEAQMKWLEEQFEGAGWQANRVIEGMKQSKDFYMQMIAQVKVENFVRGRVALMGDAGYCPSPISGMGTSIGIIGAYVLAGEISKSPSDIPKALQKYQEILEPFVSKVQRLLPGAPQIANPQSQIGISILNTVTGIAASNWFRKIVGATTLTLPSKGWEPPKYAALAG